MNAVVDPGIDIDKALPRTRSAGRRRRRLGGRAEGGRRHERARSTDPRASGGQGPARLHLPAGRGGDGRIRFVLRGLPLRPRRPVRGAHGAGRRPRTGRRGDGGGEDRRPAAAPGGRRPSEVPAGGAGLRRAGRPAGESRDPGSPAPGEERPRPPEPDGETRRARAGKAAQEQEDPQEQRTPQRAYALVRQAQGEGRREPPRPGPPVRDAGDEESEAPHGLDGGRVRRPGGGGRDGPPGGPGRRPLAGRDRLRGRGTRPRTEDIRRGAHRLRRPRRRHPSGRHGSGHPRPGLRRAGGHMAALLGVRPASTRGSASTTRSPSADPRRPSPCPGRTPSVRPGR